MTGTCIMRELAEVVVRSKCLTPRCLGRLTSARGRGCLQLMPKVVVTTALVSVLLLAKRGCRATVASRWGSSEKTNVTVHSSKIDKVWTVWRFQDAGKVGSPTFGPLRLARRQGLSLIRPAEQPNLCLLSAILRSRIEQSAKPLLQPRPSATATTANPLTRDLSP